MSPESENTIQDADEWLEWLREKIDDSVEGRLEVARTAYRPIGDTTVVMSWLGGLVKVIQDQQHRIAHLEAKSDER